ncbi:hypothetical protein GDO81_027110 [Engystomops pustulosus]|uniref:BLUF domain-containing protein n=1 Tax=Engystomops pustulosus TaxID=76066 RepID=A0AAV6ZPN9_ENGPU|nr:hypothetical protein GDO81_027110 [Engystomops pustulosus]
METGKVRAQSWKSEPTPEKMETSFFHQLLNKRMVLSARDDVKSLLHRLIFVSKISPDLADKRDLGEYWEQQFQRYNQGENVTGLLLLYPAYTVHCLESSGDVLYCVIRDLQRMKKQGDRALVLDPKIVVTSHNISSRLFSQWSYKVLDVPGQYLGDKFSEEATDGIITECLTKILKIGKHLTKYPKGSKNIPDSVFEKVPELTIPQTSILHLLQCKDLLTPEQFLKMYDSPLNVMLDSDRVWPTPVHLTPLKTRSLQ